MAFFGPMELARLALVRADVVSAISQTMQDFEDITGHKSYVNSGWRSKDEQRETQAAGQADGFRAASADTSRHPLGAAVDLVIVGTGKDAALDQNNPLYKTLADIGVRNGLVAGYYFKGGLPDPYHFEAKETLSVSQAKWAALIKERQSRSLVVGAIVLVILVVVNLMRKR